MTYAGKRVVVTGCSSGIGAPLAARLVEAGARVHGFDIAAGPDLALSGFARLDLRDAGAIEAAVLPDRVDALFACAGISQYAGLPPADVMAVNFVGMRAFANRASDRMAAGGAIAAVGSMAGWGWPRRLAELRDLCATADFAEAMRWVESHPEYMGASYEFSKEAVIVWTLSQAHRFIARGIRLNCLCPGPVDTPMLAEIAAGIGPRKIDATTWPIGRKSRPEEQAEAMLFLNSERASYVNGIALDVDGGLHGSVISGEVDLASMLAEPEPQTP